ncbi:hypothetical protein [Kitasatospora mediocidica]|uniref:hypothetical protein n=1 Tax=Kitasatospora mediocidica TaxID=58352 RepID=UPI00056C0C0B|nr:hypothetical protein [Kitasatospora mediocidica]
MAWTWRYEAADGSVITPAEEAEDFPGQGDAESWIGEEWKQLLEQGIEKVALLDDGREIYTMSLRES